MSNAPTISRNALLAQTLRNAPEANIRKFYGAVTQMPAAHQAKIAGIIKGCCDPLDCGTDQVADPELTESLLRALGGDSAAASYRARSRQGAKSPAEELADALNMRFLTGPSYRKEGCRKSVLSFPTTSVAAGAASGAINSSVMLEAFKPERLIVASDIAGQFNITDLVINGRTQFVTNIGVSVLPARAFTEVAIPMEIEFDLAASSPTAVIQIFVTNTSGQAVSFNAVLYGTMYTRN